MNNLKLLYYYLLDSFGCTAPVGIFYKIFEKLAGKLTCLCCIFWRGFLIGLVIGIVTGVLL